MSSKASVLHHPLHPMTIVFPLAFFFGSAACDLLYSTGLTKDPVVREMGYYLMGAGILGAGKP